MDERTGIQIEQWLEEESDVGGCSSEEEQADYCSNSNHDSESEIDAEELGDMAESGTSVGITQDQEEEEEVSGDYFKSRNKKPPVLKWQETPPFRSVRTRSHNIVLHIPGVKQAARSVKLPLECFSLYFDEEILNLLVSNTNIYIEKIRTNYKRERDAKEVSMDEMKASIGLLIMAGVMRASYLHYLDLWDTDGSAPEMFRLTMSYKRFLFILRCLRFDDIRSREERVKEDYLAPIREISALLEDKFQKAYSLGENVTIDETLVGFRGRFKGKVYMPKKPNKYGIKIQAMVDARTFYLHSFEIYGGKQTCGPYSVSNSPDEILKRLVEKNQGFWQEHYH